MKYLMTFRLCVILYCTSVLILSPSLTYSQSVDTIRSCSTVFFDAGGINGNYLPNSNETYVICPDTGSAGFTKLEFYNLALEPGDRLEIFDGLDVNAIRLGVLTSNSEAPYQIFQASASNTSRCLTVQFISDDSDQRAGWEAQVSCVDSCQSIVANITGTTPNPFGGTVNVCPGERILFFGEASFPEAGLFYEQSDTNSTYRWDFGDGSFASGQVVSHEYFESGGYTVRLMVIDPFGCTNANIAIQKVQVAPSPDFSFSIPELGPICIGDTLNLTSTLNEINPNKTISVVPGSASFSSEYYKDDNEAIPDGAPDPLISSIIVDRFEAGQTLDDPNDLLAICLDIEHSRLEDLDISLICPNGQELVLHSNTGFAIDPTLIGLPNIGDEGRVLPGQAGTYCWKNDNALLTWSETIQADNPFTLPEGDYAAEEAWTELQGCPLNGIWNLAIRDTQVTANGYLFNWRLQFAEDLDADLEVFTPPLVIQEFVFEPDLPFYFQDSILVSPLDPGYKFYQLEVTNTFNCRYDTSIAVAVRAETSPECTSCDTRYTPIPDTTICLSEELQIAIEGSIPNETTITYQSDPRYSFGFVNHPPDNPFAAPILVGGVAQDSLSNPFIQIVSICLNINTDFNADIAIFLKAPDGKLLELSTNNGGGFNNYTNTCFSPLGTDPITIGAPPFQGTYIPEGNWSDLTGSPINGTWELLVSDAFDLSSLGELVDWEITFNSTNEFDISWTPSTGLSCTDCPNPVVNPSETTDYTVSFTDSYGCSFSDNFRVTVLDTFAAPEIICGPLSPGNMIFNWNSIGLGLSYEGTLTINGVDSILANPIQDTFLIVDGLVFGDVVTLELNVVPPDTLYPCFVGQSQSTCTFEDCFTFTQFEYINDVDCFGEATGSVAVRALRGFRPFTYYLNGDFVGQQDSVFNNLAAGNYILVTEDMTGCSDTLNFTIQQSEPISTSLTAFDTIACFGDSTATILADVSGGTGMLNLSWNYSLIQDPTQLEQIPAGNYVLTVEDELGCQAQDSTLINEPDNISVSTDISPISCAGDANGGINASINGGTGNLDFTWNNGTNDTVLTNLAEGTYTITISDENNCTLVDSVELIAPLPLVTDSIILQTVGCFGRSNGEAEVQVSGGTAPYNYNWLDSLNQITSRATNLPGGFVEVRITDQNGCLVTEVLEIPEPLALAIDFSTVDVACRGETNGLATAIVMGGTEPYNYNWQTGSQDTSARSLGVGSYTITVTDNNGCIINGTTSISEPSTDLVVSASQITEGCFGEQTNRALALANGGGDGLYTYLWSNGQTTNEAFDLDSIEYTVTVTDVNGCRREASINLVDLPPMQPNMIINAPSCFGFNNGAIGINFVEGRPNANLNEFQFMWNTGQLGPTIGNLRGDSLYTVTVTDPNGCTAIESRFVRQPKLITFQIVENDASCFGGSNGSLDIINISADSENFSYQWDDRTGNQTTSEATNLSAGVYTVTIADEFGCSNVGQATVGEPTRIEVSFQQIDNTCFADQTGSLEAFAAGGSPTYRFAWSNGALGAEIENLIAGDYTVTVTDARNCFQTATVTLNQPAAIGVTIETQDVTCFGESDGSVNVLTDGGAPPYLFKIGNQDFTGSPFLIGLPANTYPITIQDANGCSFTTDAVVNQPEPFSVDLGPAERALFLGDSITLRPIAENGQGMVSFEWIESYPGSVPCLICDSVTVKPDFATDYQILALDSVGCQAEDFIRIFVEKEQILAIPTGFTPNGDQNNDRLIIHGKEGTLINLFQVFDRHGSLVYEARELNLESPEIGWDGMLNGEEMAQDTYIWFIQATFDNQITKVFRGQTTLIR